MYFKKKHGHIILVYDWCSLNCIDNFLNMWHYKFWEKMKIKTKNKNIKT